MRWPHSAADPTPAQIRQRCEAIQATWSAEERYRRRATFADPHHPEAMRYARQKRMNVAVIRMADVEAVAE